MTVSVSIARLRAVVAAGEQRGEWPRRIAAILAVSQGDYDWTEETAAAIHEAIASGDAERNLADLLPCSDDDIWVQDYPQHYAPQLFFVASLLDAAREPAAQLADLPATKATARIFDGSVDVRGDFEAEGRIVVCGNLRVDGDATFRDELVVIGNLEVEGRLLLENTWTATAIVGDVRVSGPMLIRSETYVGGDVRAQSVLVDNPEWVGSLQVCGDLDTAMIVEAIAPDVRSAVHGTARITDPDVEGALERIAAAFG